jgi:hypothetical protein
MKPRTAFGIVLALAALIMLAAFGGCRRTGPSVVREFRTTAKVAAIDLMDWGVAQRTRVRESYTGRAYRGDNVTLATGRELTIACRDRRGKLLGQTTTRNGEYRIDVEMSPEVPWTWTCTGDGVRTEVR